MDLLINFWEGEEGTEHLPVLLFVSEESLSEDHVELIVDVGVSGHLHRGVVGHLQQVLPALFPQVLHELDSLQLPPFFDLQVSHYLLDPILDRKPTVVVTLLQQTLYLLYLQFNCL